ncbi:hypothetical protein D3C84_1189720 [compost metagenome]
MVPINPRTIASSRRTFAPCKAKTSSVSKAVKTTPDIIETPSNKWNARAAPKTSAKSVARIDSSASSH